MTQWQLGDKAAARRSLADAMAAMDEDIDKSTWDEAAILKLYRREAEALIQPTPDKTSSTVKDGRAK